MTIEKKATQEPEKTAATPVLSRGQKTQRDITALLKAGNTLLWVVTREEYRIEGAVKEAGANADYPMHVWDVAAGHQPPEGEPVLSRADPKAMLRWIGDDTASGAPRGIYVMRDLHLWLRDATTLRVLRSLARKLEQPQDAAKMRRIIVLTPVEEIPLELTGHAVQVVYPIPDRIEMASILDSALSVLPEIHPTTKKPVRALAAPNGTREAAIDAAVGLTSQEATNCFTKSLVETRGKIVPSIIAAEKKRVIEREKLLTWHDPDPRGLDAIGGLDLLKAWLLARKAGFSQRARAFGLPSPKGALITGVSGTGKSLTAKCAATAYGVPLVRIDFGALQSKYVGESQANIRKALSVAETISPCIVWADEIEKALAGAVGTASDGGVAADAMGTLLTWMQEQSGVFVLATANDVRKLPPEILRKGRFDDVFFVDLPTRSERAAILVTALKQYKRDPATIDIEKIVKCTDLFTGSEIAGLVPEALFTAFAEDERELRTSDLEAVACALTPLAKTAEDQVRELRAWGQKNARPASSPEIVAPVKAGRGIDLGDPSAN